MKKKITDAERTRRFFKRKLPAKPCEDVKIILDSGAFTAYSKNIEINLKTYIEFLHKNLQYLEAYVNLDCIPGKVSLMGSTEETEKTAKVSFKNYMTMLEEGLNPIPVFHCGESFKWLDKILSTGTEYFGLGALVGKPKSITRNFFNKVFAYLEKQGASNVKVHGFGIASIDLIINYPWYSVDSTTWVKGGAFGGINVPNLIEGTYSYAAGNVISISSRVMQKKGVLDKRSYYSLNDPQKKYVDDYLISLGIDNPSVVMKSRNLRILANCHYFHALSEEIKGMNGKKRRKSLFEDKSIPTVKCDAKVYFGAFFHDISYLAIVRFCQHPYVFASYMDFVINESRIFNLDWIKNNWNDLVGVYANGTF